MAATQVSDIIVPDVFLPYQQQLTEEKSRLIQSGAVIRNPMIDQFLAGGGKTFTVPSIQDLDATDATGSENVATDSIADVQTLAAGGGTTLAAQNDARPAKIETSEEIAARQVRNKSWNTTNLSVELSGADPAGAIAERLATWRARRDQKMFVSAIRGVFAKNATAPSGSDQHTANDLIRDISGSSFTDGVTNFSGEALIDAAVTAGDSIDNFTMLMVHSVVFARMRKQGLIDFERDQDAPSRIARYQDLEVIVDDGMPVTGGVYDSWLFSPGAVQMGFGQHRRPTAVHYEELAGNGDGQEIFTTRWVQAIHPTGYAYVQSSIPDGGPSNTNLATASSWSRRYPERKQIGMALLRTRESA